MADSDLMRAAAIVLVIVAAAQITFLWRQRQQGRCGWEPLYVLGIQFFAFLLKAIFSNAGFVYLTASQEMPWITYASWLLSCPGLIIQVSNLPLGNAKRPDLMVTAVIYDQAMLLLGITSVCYAGEIKFFLVIGSVILAILTLQIVAETFVRAFNSYPHGPIRYWIVVAAASWFIGWLMYPIIFLASVQSFGTLPTAVAETIHALADLFAKNAYLQMSWYVRWVLLREHLEKSGEKEDMERRMVAVDSIVTKTRALLDTAAAALPAKAMRSVELGVSSIVGSALPAAISYTKRHTVHALVIDPDPAVQTSTRARLVSTSLGPLVVTNFVFRISDIARARIAYDRRFDLILVSKTALIEAVVATEAFASSPDGERGLAALTPRGAIMRTGAGGAVATAASAAATAAATAAAQVTLGTTAMLDKSVASPGSGAAGPGQGATGGSAVGGGSTSGAPGSKVTSAAGTTTVSGALVSTGSFHATSTGAVNLGTTPREIIASLRSFAALVAVFDLGGPHPAVMGTSEAHRRRGAFGYGGEEEDDDEDDDVVTGLRSDLADLDNGDRRVGSLYDIGADAVLLARAAAWDGVVTRAATAVQLTSTNPSDAVDGVMMADGSRGSTRSRNRRRHLDDITSSDEASDGGGGLGGSSSSRGGADASNPVSFASVHERAAQTLAAPIASLIQSALATSLDVDLRPILASIQTQAEVARAQNPVELGSWNSGEPTKAAPTGAPAPGTGAASSTQQGGGAQSPASPQTAGAAMPASGPPSGTAMKQRSA